MFGDDATYCNSTLIICPMTVMSNWTDQFKEHVDPCAKVQVYLYYGADRIKDVDYLRKHDVVITTYVCIPVKWKEFLVLSLSFHNQLFSLPRLSSLHKCGGGGGGSPEQISLIDSACS